MASLAEQRVFVSPSPSQVALWQNSAPTAVAAEPAAELPPALKLDTGRAYLAGLLHDIGRLVMVERALEQMLKADESNRHSPETLIEADMEIFKFTHRKLGPFAYELWGLPDALAAVVRRHHGALADLIKPGSVDAYVGCEAIADRIASDLALQEKPRPVSEQASTAIDQVCGAMPTGGQQPDASALATRTAATAERSTLLLEELGLGLSGR